MSNGSPMPVTELANSEQGHIMLTSNHICMLLCIEVREVLASRQFERDVREVQTTGRKGIILDEKLSDRTSHF